MAWFRDGAFRAARSLTAIPIGLSNTWYPQCVELLEEGLFAAIVFKSFETLGLVLRINQQRYVTDSKQRGTIMKQDERTELEMTGEQREVEIADEQLESMNGGMGPVCKPKKKRYVPRKPKPGSDTEDGSGGATMSW